MIENHTTGHGQQILEGASKGDMKVQRTHLKVVN